MQQHPAADRAKLGQYRRLVELQSQLVALARKNELAAQQCDALWRELERNAQATGCNAPIAALARRLDGLRQHLASRLRARAAANDKRIRS